MLYHQAVPIIEPPEVETALILGSGMTREMLSERIFGSAGRPSAPVASLQLRANVDVLECRLIEQALLRAEGSRTGAARLLGISRNGLALKMDRLGLEGSTAL